MNTFANNTSENNYAVEYLCNRFDTSNFFYPSQVTEWRPPKSSLEADGVFFNICYWVTHNIDGEYDWDEVFNNTNGWRNNYKGGSFNVHDNYKLYDPEGKLEVTDFILQDYSVYAEITDTTTDTVVGYIYIS